MAHMPRLARTRHEAMLKGEIPFADGSAPPLPPEIAAKRWFLVSAGAFTSAITPDNRSLVIGRDHDPIEDAFTTKAAVARGPERGYVWLPETYYEGVQVLVNLKASGATGPAVDILPWLNNLAEEDVEAIRKDPFQIYRHEPDILATLHQVGDPSLLFVLQNIPFERAAPYFGVRIVDLDLLQKGLDD